MNSSSSIITEAQAGVQPAAIRDRTNKAGPRRQGHHASSQKVSAPRAKPNKTQTVITLLRRKKGATIDELVKATGWQQHSVRGLISGTIKKKMHFSVIAGKDENLDMRYRIVTGKGAKR